MRDVEFQQPMLINHPTIEQRFKSFEIAASKRMSNRWMFDGLLFRHEAAHPVRRQTRPDRLHRRGG